MLQVGQTDVFERIYTQKLRALAAAFGEFVTYERDRGARDLGIHLTQKNQAGGERLSSALCWFQLKGIMAATLPRDRFEQSTNVSISLKVAHLRYWYLQPMPTYLALFIESADVFLVLNLQAYVEATWGRGILTLAQNEVTVAVPRSSILDAQAFALILQRSDIAAWVRALGTDEENARLCQRDYNLIWHFGTAARRKVEHQISIVDWQSKFRGELYVQESSTGQSQWETLRSHWQAGMRADEVEGAYPYLELFAPDCDCWADDDSDDSAALNLSNGDIIQGADCAGEYFEYTIGARLNDLGLDLFESVEALAKIGLLQIDESSSDFVSVAPWHHRSV